MNNKMQYRGHSSTIEDNRGLDNEYYTYYEDIAKEIPNYKDELKGKVIYCPCDNPDSNFVKYFKDEFHNL